MMLSAFSLDPGMPHVPQFIRQGLVGHRVGGKMAEVAIGKGAFRPLLRLIKELEAHVPGVRTFIVREIFLADDDVGHEFP